MALTAFCRTLAVVAGCVALTGAATAYAAAANKGRKETIEYKQPPRERVIWINRDLKIESKGLIDPRTLTMAICTGVSCTVDIQVTVDPDNNDPTGRTCAFQVTPTILVMRNKNAVISFKLTEVTSTKGANFTDNPAQSDDGIFIPKDSADFKSRNRQPQQFQWSRNKTAGAGQMFAYGYDINVSHTFGGGKCDVPDPIMINRD